MDGQSASSEASRSRRRARDELRRARTSPFRVLPPPVLDARTLPITANRSFASPSSSHLHRHRLRRYREDDVLGREYDVLGTVQDTVNRLDEVTSTLASAIEAPLPHVGEPATFFTAHADDTEGYSRRSKRRKLDSDPLDTWQNPSYGYHGQVVPGRLKMQIVSCDGGHVIEPDEVLGQRVYLAENVLRNDKSVYCTKKDKCNILLKHQGGTQFTVTKIVIKTPDSGFTAPYELESSNLKVKTDVC